MERYYYAGPVTSFGICISNHWYGETIAISEKKAKNNLEYQFKKQNNMLPSCEIKLEGSVRLVS